MEAPKPIFTECVSAGTRVYYIDVYNDTNSQKYITLTEIPVEKAIPDEVRKRERQRIFIHANNIDAFCDALKEAVHHTKTGDE